MRGANEGNRLGMPGTSRSDGIDTAAATGTPHSCALDERSNSNLIIESVAIARPSITDWLLGVWDRKKIRQAPDADLALELALQMVYVPCPASHREEFSPAALEGCAVSCSFSVEVRAPGRGCPSS